MDKLSKIQFLFSTLHWPAKSDIHSRMSNTHSPRRLQSVCGVKLAAQQGFWLVKKVEGEAGRVIWFQREPEPFLFFFSWFNFPQTGNSESISFWHYQYMPLPTGNSPAAPAAAGWNQHLSHKHPALPPAAAQIAPRALICRVRPSRAPAWELI